MISRYDADADILYMLIKEGEIQDTVEISEDVFIEYDEKNNPMGIELWRARKNVFGELLKYLNTIADPNIGSKSTHEINVRKVIQQ
ncbi:MAG: DUF2283 domain-containing protein [Methanosarcinales archaeon]|nr:DUF2283 domain-containing protein [Methanosarcinales archaeon]